MVHLPDVKPDTIIYEVGHIPTLVIGQVEKSPMMTGCFSDDLELFCLDTEGEFITLIVHAEDNSLRRRCIIMPRNGDESAIRLDKSADFAHGPTPFHPGSGDVETALR